jgi:hypothetical protein
MADKPEALLLADDLQEQAVWESLYGPSHLRDLLPEAAAELRRLHAVNAELLEALVSFTKSGYIKKQHPKRYAAAVAAIAKAEKT